MTNVPQAASTPTTSEFKKVPVINSAKLYDYEASIADIFGPVEPGRQLLEAIISAYQANRATISF